MDVHEPRCGDPLQYTQILNQTIRMDLKYFIYSTSPCVRNYHNWASLKQGIFAFSTPKVTERERQQS